VLNEDGDTVASFEYDAFGNTIKSVGGPYVSHNCFRFSTKYCDPETGLYYYGRRFYNPALGRWMSRDPIGEGGAENLQAFLCNDTLSQSDLFGLQSTSRKIISRDVFMSTVSRGTYDRKTRICDCYKDVQWTLVLIDSRFEKHVFHGPAKSSYVTTLTCIPDTSTCLNNCKLLTYQCTARPGEEGWQNPPEDYSYGGSYSSGVPPVPGN
jgi:RHS repeat-associated protein